MPTRERNIEHHDERRQYAAENASTGSKKDYSAEIGTTPDGGVTFLASVFSNVDLVGDICMPGCFSKSLKAWRDSGDPIPICFSHDWSDPFAILGAADPTLCRETAKGLLIVGHLDIENNPVARQVHSLMTRRIVREASFAYDIVQERKITSGQNKGANALYEVNILEVGPCLKGANPLAGLSKDALQRWKRGQMSKAQYQAQCLRTIEVWSDRIGLHNRETAELRKIEQTFADIEMRLASPKAYSDPKRCACGAYLPAYDQAEAVVDTPDGETLSLGFIRHAECSSCGLLTLNAPDAVKANGSANEWAGHIRKARAEHEKRRAERAAADAERVKTEQRRARSAEIRAEVRRFDDLLDLELALKELKPNRADARALLADFDDALEEGDR